MHNLLLCRALQQDNFRLPAGAWLDTLVSRLEVYFPTHAELAQPGAFRQLAQQMARKRESLRFTRPDDVGHAVALQVGFGHRWYRDPALGWMRAALERGGISRLRQVALERLPNPGEGDSN